jgi:L-amino acid N-acyltransferase YncA
MSEIFAMQQRDYGGVDDSTAFDAACLDADQPDRNFAVMDGRDRLRARCSIWWRDTALVDGGPIGAVGHYAADDAESAGMLLDYACQQLQSKGCSYAIGPLDGNTWRRYRFVTSRGTEKPFFMEPDNPDEWPQHFLQNGFASWAHYVSEMNPDIRSRKPGLGHLRKKFADLGVTIEPIGTACPQSDLQHIYDVVCESFANSVLYTDPDFDSFVQQYAPLIGTVDPRLMLVARHEGRVVGFVFAPPDLLQNSDPRGIDTIVIKTVAILPREKYSGLGRLLITDMLHNAQSMGYRRAISALMHTGNSSMSISADCAGPMRGYELFARCLNS